MTDPDTVSTYEAVADQYHRRHADRSGVEALVEQFLQSVDATTDGSTSRVLDVGTGPGWESATFTEHGHDTVGVDLTPAFLEIAREKATQAAFLRMDMRRLGLQRNAFDGVWACASLLHVPREDVPATLSEFRRVLRPGGVALLSVKRGDGTTTGSGYDGDARRFTLFQPDEFESMVADAGLDVRSTTPGDPDHWIQLEAEVPET
ncbi:class I SAM-dependent DNA methyltransferase [Halobacteriaceae archaeon GCM10025711]